MYNWYPSDTSLVIVEIFVTNHWQLHYFVVPLTPLRTRKWHWHQYLSYCWKNYDSSLTPVRWIATYYWHSSVVSLIIENSIHMAYRTHLMYHWHQSDAWLIPFGRISDQVCCIVFLILLWRIYGISLTLTNQWYHPEWSLKPIGSAFSTTITYHWQFSDIVLSLTTISLFTNAGRVYQQSPWYQTDVYLAKITRFGQWQKSF